MEAFKGRLLPDGNRKRRVKPQAGFTVRQISRTVGKPELSEPTLIYRIGEDTGQKLPRG